jgi:hypothetical protein
VLRLTCTSTHRLAELNVGKMRDFVRREAATLNSMMVQLSVEHDPLEATAEYSEDPFHSEIFGTPAFDPADQVIAVAIGDLIARCIGPLYEAKPPSRRDATAPGSPRARPPS